MRQLIAVKGERILIDEEDFAALSTFIWRVDSRGYATRSIRHPDNPARRTQELLHRVVLGLSHGDGLEGDHKNGNTLDNRRSNLRVCSRAQNQMNRARPRNNKSGFKGVTWDRRKGRWQVFIGIGGKNKFLGLFDTPEEGHLAYCAAAAKMHGEFCNFGLVEQKDNEYNSRRLPIPPSA